MAFISLCQCFIDEYHMVVEYNAYEDVPAQYQTLFQCQRVDESSSQLSEFAPAGRSMAAFIMGEDVSRCVKMCQDVSRCVKMCQDVQRQVAVFIPECFLG
jgi:predicted molibdopterin-dependent oxidoreductase YjgC